MSSNRTRTHEIAALIEAGWTPEEINTVMTEFAPNSLDTTRTVKYRPYAGGFCVQEIRNAIDRLGKSGLTIKNASD
ncbi:MAG: hypothetical protein AAGJ95_09470 [Cyanobacteria bacterium J06554_11]